jgi:pentapeptide MXKDX repeat protein
MRRIWVLFPAVVVGFGIGFGIAGCGSSTPAGKDKMGGDKMSTDKMGGEKMDGGKMGGDKMKGDKMEHQEKM